MKHFFTICLFLLAFSVQSQTTNASLNTTFLGNWDDNSLPVQQSLGLVYNSVWGWVGAGGKEYAVLGSQGKIHFFDVTDPTNITLLKEFAGTQNTIWREFKSYKNHVYAVCDGCSEGLQIFDVSQPSNIQRTYFSNALFGKSHTITCDTTSGRLYLNGTDVASAGILVLDIKTDPNAPTLLANTDLTLTGGTASGGYVHDSYVRRDTVYASHGYGGFVVWDFKNPTTPVNLASVSTGGYNHSSWLTNDGKTIVYAEEVPAGLPLHVVDLTKLYQHEISIAKAFKFPLHAPKDTNMTYHNVYIKDNLCYVASYLDGLQVFDIKNPKNPLQVAYYDTEPLDSIYSFPTPSGGHTGYAGCWGAYPWLPSGTILASDMQNGLYTLKLSTTATASPTNKLKMLLYPNPFSDMINFDFGDKTLVAGTYSIYNTSGALVLQADFSPTNRLCFNTGNLPSGLYFLKIKTTDGRVLQRKMIKN